jgi:hypothetical protein
MSTAGEEASGYEKCKTVCGEISSKEATSTMGNFVWSTDAAKDVVATDAVGNTAPATPTLIKSRLFILYYPLCFLNFSVCYLFKSKN